MKFSSCLLLGGVWLPALAAALPPPADPADPRAAVPAPTYATALATYVPAAAPNESPDQLWLENNRKLSAAGGMGHMMMMAAPPVLAKSAKSAKSAGLGAADAPAVPHPAAMQAAPAPHVHTPGMAPSAQSAQSVNSKPEDNADAPMAMPMNMPMDHLHH